MSIYQYCVSVFPNTSFTGGSKIHASLANTTSLYFKFGDKRAILASILDTKIPESVISLLSTNFGKMTFLLGNEDLVSLMMADFYSYLTNSYDLKDKDYLTNPVTKNKFHKIAIYRDLVGGIRVWITNTGNSVTLGFRFRIEKLKSTEASLRNTIEEQCKVSNEVMESIKLIVATPEPYVEEKPLRVRIQNV